MNILFVGIGKMGLPMALHLLQAGHAVKVIDINPEQISQAGQLGLIAGSENDFHWADWLISSLPNDDAFIQFIKKICVSTKAPAQYIDTSTISLSASTQAAVWCQEKNIKYLRVTVSGNNHMAQAAQLTILCSGVKELYEQAQSILSCWGPKVLYLGDREQAKLMKLVVNLMIAQTSAMLAEGLTLGRLGNLDWQDMWQVITQSAVGSPILKAKMAQLGQPLGQRDFTPTFTIEQMIKDLTLIKQAAQDFGAPIAQTQLTLEWLTQMQQSGDGLLDYAAIIQLLEKKVGLSI